MYNKLIFSFLIVISISFLLSSCTTFEKSYVENKKIDTKLYVGECENEYVKKLNQDDLNNESTPNANVESFGTIGAVIAKSLIDQSLEKISNTLTNLAADDVKSYSLSQNIGYSQQPDIPTCIRIIRSIYPRKNNIEDNLNVEFLYINSNKKTKRSHFFIQPIYVKYKGHLPNEKKTSKQRSLRIQIEHINAGENKATELAGFDFSHIDLTDGKNYISSKGILNGRFQTPWKLKSTRTIPYTIRVTISETRKGSSFAKILARTFADSKSEIATVTKAKVDASSKVKSEEQIINSKIAEGIETEKLISEYNTAIKKAEIATDKFKQACACATKPSEELRTMNDSLFIIQQAANLSGARINRTPIYSSERRLGCAGIKMNDPKICAGTTPETIQLKRDERLELNNKYMLADAAFKNEKKSLEKACACSSGNESGSILVIRDKILIYKEDTNRLAKKLGFPLLDDDIAEGCGDYKRDDEEKCAE